MKCPFCLNHYHGQEQFFRVGRDDEAHWGVASQNCPACGKLIICLCTGVCRENQGGWQWIEVKERIGWVRPRVPNRQQVPPAVPAEYREDYEEACLVLVDSPKASAALSRRCLQHLLREALGVPPSELSREIQAVLDRKQLPTHLAESIDAVRLIGNFAAHPQKETSSGQILPVEAGEAEWTLDLLEGLFDFLFVQPALTKQKRDALEAKVAAAGKPPMKKP